MKSYLTKLDTDDLYKSHWCCGHNGNRNQKHSSRYHNILRAQTTSLLSLPMVKGIPIGLQLPEYTDGQDTSPLLLRQKVITFLIFTLSLCGHSYLPLGYSSHYVLLPSFWKCYLQGNPLLLMVLEELQVSTNWLLNPLYSWTTMGILKQTKIRLHLLIVWQSYRWPVKLQGFVMWVISDC